VGYKEPFSLQDGLPLDHAPNMKREQEREEDRDEEGGGGEYLNEHCSRLLLLFLMSHFSPFLPPRYDQRVR